MQQAIIRQHINTVKLLRFTTRTRVRLNRPPWNLRACTHFMKISLRLFKLDLEL